MKSTEQLITECCDFSRSSQNELYHRFSELVMSIARRYMTNDYKAKDVFLRSFEKALNNIKDYNSSKGSFQSWLSRITINEALNQIKYEKRFEFTEINEVEFYLGKVEPIDDLDYETIMNLIAKLKMPYGLIFNMVYAGYKHKEIATQFNITEATSRSYYKRSRQMMQKVLSENYTKEVK